MEELISIVVAIYNVEKYLHECVESIINQTYKNLEIILVDDGSLDNCPQICDDYAQNDSRIKVIHKQNGGLVSAIQYGVRQSTGKFLGFVDSDDSIDKEMYLFMLNYMQVSNADVVCSGFKYCDDENNYISNCTLENKEYTKGENIDNLCKCLFQNKNIINVAPNRWSKLYKTKDVKKIIEQCNEKISMGEDLVLNVLVFNNINKLVVTEKCFYNYRYNINSISKAGLHWNLYLKAYIYLNEVTKYYDECIKISLYQWLIDAAKGSLVEIQKKISSKTEQIIKQKEILNNENVRKAMKIIDPIAKGLKNKIFNFSIKKKSIWLIRTLIKLNRIITYKI